MNNINEYIQEKLVINKNIKSIDHLFSFNEFKEELMNTLKVNQHECNTIIENFDTDIDIIKMPKYKYQIVKENDNNEKLFKYLEYLKKHPFNTSLSATLNDFSSIWHHTEYPEIHIYFYNDWIGLTDGHWYIYIIDNTHSNDYIYEIIRK